MPWDGLSWDLRAPEDSEEGRRTNKHDRKRGTGYPGSGLSEEITPLLLLYDGYMSSQMELQGRSELYGERKKKLCVLLLLAV
jgi:hypothetical protein